MTIHIGETGQTVEPGQEFTIPSLNYTLTYIRTDGENLILHDSVGEFTRPIRQKYPAEDGRRIAPVEVDGQKVLPKTVTRTRTDVITYVDSDGNPETEYFINGQEILAPITWNIHEHVIDPGRSGGSHAWACSMYDSASNSGIPAAVRTKFADAIETSGHNCHKEQCTACENCVTEPCPLITDTARKPRKRRKPKSERAQGRPRSLPQSM
ncbi:hypothetical protein ACIQC7_35425 [Kitasatospora sp. NPDC088556]|uniref:hypothetical protein n=1 Tax=Kitasatospora sp. NPDC088556 TaxID=3364076 RepID=UPI0037F8A6A9